MQVLFYIRVKVYQTYAQLCKEVLQGNYFFTYKFIYMKPGFLNCGILSMKWEGYKLFQTVYFGTDMYNVLSRSY
jgi:hypothetical protein